jgi:hypothetical protein
VSFVTTPEMVAQIAEASARLMTSRNSWLRLVAFEIASFWGFLHLFFWF